MNRIGSLADIVNDSGPRKFTKSETAAARDLFADRSALFFTPTSSIPMAWVGEGTLDVKLPVSIPSWLEYLEVPGYRSPRFWVDQLQRATGKLRWRPVKRARIKFVIYDTYVKGSSTVIKSALDALKVKTTGRKDGRSIFYFGAIVDDNWQGVDGCDIIEEYVATPREAGCRLVVEPTELCTQRSTHLVNHPVLMV